MTDVRYYCDRHTFKIDIKELDITCTGESFKECIIKANEAIDAQIAEHTKLIESAKHSITELKKVRLKIRGVI